MATTYSYGRTSLPSLAVSAVSGSIQGANTTYYFWLQGRNRAGYTLVSSSTSLVVANNTGINIVIPVTARRSGEDWREFTISASTTNNPSSATVVAVMRGYESDEITPIDLATCPPIVLDLPAHLILATNTAAFETNTLPLGTSLKHGMRRKYLNNNAYYTYDQYSTKTVDNYDVLSASTGRWLRVTGINEYLTDITIGAGSSIVDVNSSKLITVDYTPNGSNSIPVGYYLINDSGATIVSGTRIDLVTRINNIDANTALSGLIDVAIVGYVNMATGILDTTNILLAGTYVTYSREERSLYLPKDLPINYAVYISVRTKFTSLDLQKYVPLGSDLTVYPYITSVKGVYSDANIAVGDGIFSEYDKRLVVPDNTTLSAIGLNGSGIVKNYSFRNVGTQEIAGIDANTANQNIYITRHGALVTDAVSDKISTLRAIISTELGYSLPIAFSSTFSISGTQSIQVTVNYPNAIRSNYPDTLIAGSNKGKFNANFVAIYLFDVTNNLYRRYIFPITPLAASDTFTITTTTAIPTISLPTPTANFSLFNPTSISRSTLSTGGTITASNYQISAGFYYDGNQVTKISHSTIDGCITTYTTSIGKALLRAAYWAEPVGDTTQLAGIVEGEISPYQARYVADKNYYYVFSPIATESAENIRPTYLTALDPGRWVPIKNSTWYIGAGVPSSSLGLTGDFYLDNTNLNVYEKTSITVWTLRNRLGQNIITAAGAPDGSTGAIGDYYIDTTASALYKKTGSITWTYQAKLGSTWLSGSTNPTSGQGALGDRYVNTSTGEHFEKTTTTVWTLRGTFRVDGTVWYSGAGVPSNSLGVNGDFYMDTVAGSIYRKSGGVWGSSILVIYGTKWFSGATATTGQPPEARTGDYFIETTTGSYYVRASNGSWTFLGDIKGTSWINGDNAPTSGLGVLGDYYLDNLTGDFYKKTGVAAWTLQGTLRNAGTVWYAAAGVPSGGTGVNQDFYVNTTNNDYYRKITGTWTLQGNLNGTTWIQAAHTGVPTIGLYAVGTYLVTTDDGRLWRKNATPAWESVTKIHGSVWYAGAGTPSNGFPYIEGDVWVNTNNNDFYICNAGQVWPLSPNGNLSGAIWRVGTTAPSNSTGRNGDFWLNTLTGEFYLKASGTYTLQGSLKISGTVWLKGNGAPSGSLGTTYDYYIDQSNGTYYWKDVSGWTSQGQILGSTWYAQPNTPSNLTGINGDFFIDTTTLIFYRKEGGIWVSKGSFTGTYWRSGTTDPAGTLGNVGDFYLNTVTKNIFQKTGITTYTDLGTARGSVWYNGSGVPSGSLGIIGDYYINNLTKDYFEKTGVSTWVNRGNFIGTAVASINAIGGAVNLVAGSNVTITPGSPSAQDITIASSASTIKDEGTTQGAAGAVTTFDFVGSNVSATVSGNTATIAVSSSTALTVRDEGTSLSTTANNLDFVGSGVTASGSGANITITVPATTVKDEGTTVGTAGAITTLDFVGSGVSASATGNTATISVSGGGGGGSVDIKDEGGSVLGVASTLNIVGPSVKATYSSGTGIITVGNQVITLSTTSGDDIINTDASLGNFFKTTFPSGTNGNLLLANPTNLVEGNTYYWLVVGGLGLVYLDTIFDIKPTASIWNNAITLDLAYDGNELLLTCQYLDGKLRCTPQVGRNILELGSEKILFINGQVIFYLGFAYSNSTATGNMRGLTHRPQWIMIISKDHSNASFRGFLYTAQDYSIVDELPQEFKASWSNNVIGDINAIRTLGTDGIKIGGSEIVADFDSSFYALCLPFAQVRMDKINTGTLPGTFTHKLTVIPKFIIVNDFISNDYWIWHTSLGGNDKYLKLNSSAALATSSTIWNNTAPTTSVLSLGTFFPNNADHYIISFAEVTGEAYFGSYVGDTTVFPSITAPNFQPNMIWIKNISNIGNWIVYCRAEDLGGGLVTTYRRLDLAENSIGDAAHSIVFTSTGFDLVDPDSTSADINTNGDTYIYCVWL